MRAGAAIRSKTVHINVNVNGIGYDLERSEQNPTHIRMWVEELGSSSAQLHLLVCQIKVNSL